MRRVLFYIKRFLFFVILWGCVFQSISLLTSETLSETPNATAKETLKGCNKSIKASPKNCKGERMKEEEIKKLGITFEQAGRDVIRITGAPEDFPENDMDRIIKDLLFAFHDENMPSPETLRHRMMAYAACRGAIKRGDPLNVRQMKELITDLFHTTRPFVCPHGRPTIVKFTPDELGRLFDRT